MTTRDKLDRPPLSDEASLLLAWIKQYPKNNVEEIATIVQDGWDDDQKRASVVYWCEWLINNQYVDRAEDGTLTVRMI